MPRSTVDKSAGFSERRAERRARANDSVQQRVPRIQDTIRCRHCSAQVLAALTCVGSVDRSHVEITAVLPHSDSAPALEAPECLDGADHARPRQGVQRLQRSIAFENKVDASSCNEPSFTCTVRECVHSWSELAQIRADRFRSRIQVSLLTSLHARDMQLVVCCRGLNFTGSDGSRDFRSCSVRGRCCGSDGPCVLRTQQLGLLRRPCVVPAPTYRF